MILSKKSWHVKLHHLVYGNDKELPINFCQYFWKSIILGLVIAIIFLPPAIPIILIRRIFILLKVNKASLPPSPFEEGLWSAYSPIAIIIDLAILCIFSMFVMWFIPFKSNGTFGESFFHVMGTGSWLLLIAICFNFIIKYIKRKRYEAYRKKMEECGWKPEEKKPNIFIEGINIFIEGIKAWYKKYCPKITWKS